MDGRVRIARLAGENPAAFQPDEIEGEPLVVGGEMVALEGTLTALEHEPLPLERWGDPHGGGRSPNNGATKIECQDQGARRHHEGGPGVDPARDEEGCRDPKQADANRSGEQGCQLRRPGEDRHARDGGCRPEARPPRRLEQLGPILAAKKSPQQPRMETPLSHQPDAAPGCPDAAEQQHQRERLVAVETDQTEGEQDSETQQRQQGRDDCVGVFPHPASGS